MPNDKNRLYTVDDIGKDSKDIAKKRTSQQFSRFSTASSTSIATLSLNPPSPAVQIETNPQIGIPINDSYGSLAGITQIIPLDVYGTSYSIITVAGDIDFAFQGLPKGRHIEFTLDLLINVPEGEPLPIINLTGNNILNPPTLPPLENGTRLILHFEGVNDSTGLRFVYLGGTVEGSGIVFPINYPEHDGGTLQNITQILDFADANRHSRKYTLEGDVTFAFDNPPADKTATVFIQVVQDAVGGHSVSFPDGTVNKDAVEAGIRTGANESTIIKIVYFFGTFYAYLEGIGGSGGANTALSNLTETSINQHLLKDDGVRSIGSSDNPWNTGNFRGIHLQDSMVTPIASGFINRNGEDVLIHSGGVSRNVSELLKFDLTNLSENNLLPEDVNLNMNNNNILGLAHIDFDGDATSASIEGLRHLEFFYSPDSFQSTMETLIYNSNSHSFFIGDEIAFQILPSRGVDMFTNAINNSRLHSTLELRFDRDQDDPSIPVNVAMIVYQGVSPTSLGTMHFNVPAEKSYLFRSGSTGVGVSIYPGIGQRDSRIDTESISTRHISLLIADDEPFADGSIRVLETSEIGVDDVFIHSGGESRNVTKLLKEDLSNMFNPTIPPVDLNMNNHGILGVTHIDFDDDSETGLAFIEGLRMLQFFQDTDSFQSTQEALIYRSSSHEFFTANRGDDVVFKILSSGGINMFTNAINNSRLHSTLELRFNTGITGLVPTSNAAMIVYGIFEATPVLEVMRFQVPSGGLFNFAAGSSSVFITLDGNDGSIKANNLNAMVFGVQPSTNLPGENGIITSNGTDVFVYSGGDVRNMSQIGSGGGGGANTTLSNLEIPTAINEDLLPETSRTHNLGGVTSIWNNLHLENLRLYPSGSIQSNQNMIIADGGGMVFNTPQIRSNVSGAFEFRNNGDEILRISEDKIEFAENNREHSIEASSSAIRIRAEENGDDVELWCGSTTPQITEQNRTRWQTGTDNGSPYVIELNQDVSPIFPGVQIGLIHFAGSGRSYGRILTQALDVSSGDEDALMSLQVASGGTLRNMINLQGNGSSPRIGFFNKTAVSQPQVSGSISNLIDALVDLGLVRR